MRLCQRCSRRRYLLIEKWPRFSLLWRIPWPQPLGQQGEDSKRPKTSITSGRYGHQYGSRTWPTGQAAEQAELSARCAVSLLMGSSRPISVTMEMSNPRASSVLTIYLHCSSLTRANHPSEPDARLEISGTCQRVSLAPGDANSLCVTSKAFVN
jgi:hypothetical protein